MSSVYNCMGMVFAARRTWIDPEEIRLILEDDDYRRVSDASELMPGDVVVYRTDDGSVSHVGVISEVQIDIREASRRIVVLSQWGREGEYFHGVDDVNPRLGKPTEYWTDRV